MNRMNVLSLKLLRWSGWILVPLVLAFLATGYALSGRYGLGALLGEQQALTLHKLLHAPLLLLVLGHLAPATFLALQRWGWLRQR
jgi:hypothetical protein